MNAIARRVAQARQAIVQAALTAGRDPGEVTLVAATKTQTDDAIRQVIAAGVTVCGENRVQELTAHLAAHAYDGAQVHFIGHLQTNKVRYVVGKVDLIHSVSSEKLLLAIDKQAEKLNIVQDILLEVNLAGAAFPRRPSWPEPAWLPIWTISGSGDLCVFRPSPQSPDKIGPFSQI